MPMTCLKGGDKTQGSSLGSSSSRKEKIWKGKRRLTSEWKSKSQEAAATWSTLRERPGLQKEWCSPMTIFCGLPLCFSMSLKTGLTSVACGSCLTSHWAMWLLRSTTTEGISWTSPQSSLRVLMHCRAPSLRHWRKWDQIHFSECLEFGRSSRRKLEKFQEKEVSWLRRLGSGREDTEREWVKRKWWGRAEGGCASVLQTGWS